MSNYIHAFIAPKETYDLCSLEDNYAYCIENLSFAVSDGASLGFYSSVFSRCLVDSWVKEHDKTFTNEVCQQILKEWHSIVDEKVEKSKNIFQENALKERKESSATLVGLQIVKSEDGKSVWKSNVIGDSVLVFVRKNEHVPNFLFTTNKEVRCPEYTDKIIFDDVPKSACLYHYNSYWKDVWITDEYPLEEGTFLLMSDALAQWFIQSPQGSVGDRFDKLAALTSQQEFERFIAEERDVVLKGNIHPLQMDDVTLLVLHLDDITTIFNKGGIEERNIWKYREELKKESLKVAQEQEEEFIVLDTVSEGENEFIDNSNLCEFLSTPMPSSEIPSKESSAKGSGEKTSIDTTQHNGTLSKETDPVTKSKDSESVSSDTPTPSLESSKSGSSLDKTSAVVSSEVQQKEKDKKNDERRDNVSKENPRTSVCINDKGEKRIASMMNILLLAILISSIYANILLTILVLHLKDETTRVPIEERADTEVQRNTSQMLSIVPDSSCIESGEEDSCCLSKKNDTKFLFTTFSDSIGSTQSHVDEDSVKYVTDKAYLSCFPDSSYLFYLNPNLNIQ